MKKLRKNKYATLIVCLAVVSTIFFVWKMVDLHREDVASEEEVILAEPETETAEAETAVDMSDYKTSQVIREIDLGLQFDTDRGVTVRNLNTNDSDRITEPGIQVKSQSGARYSYAIEERMDGGQDILVSLCTEPQTNYLVSYQVLNPETGEKQVTNVTVVDGTVTAEITYNNDALVASAID